MERGWECLESAGYAVVSGFLDDDAVGALRQEFEGGRAAAKYPFGFKPVGQRAIDAARPAIARALDEIRARTSLKTDDINALTMSHYITTELAERSSYWHQDFDLNYRLTADHRNYLIFWLPLIKVDAARSNLSLVPFDALQRRSEQSYRRLVGSGGHRFIVEDGRTHVYGAAGKVLEGDALPAPEMTLDFELDELATTPHLEVGDLLLLRGDLIHRTQDVSTRRVAASIRANYSQQPIHRDRISSLIAETSRADPAARVGRLVERCLAKFERSEVTVREVLDHMNVERSR